MTLLTSIQGDITKLSVDAIANAANSRLAGGAASTGRSMPPGAR
jgi:O-acetyl-ADP-ribose deacetylase (regulator of RNase III)